MEILNLDCELLNFSEFFFILLFLFLKELLNLDFELLFFIIIIFIIIFIFIIFFNFLKTFVDFFFFNL